jgi:ACS family glucarate transporter-like MFS transporter
VCPPLAARLPRPSNAEIPTPCPGIPDPPVRDYLQFLVKGRGFNEGSLLLSALPYTVAACANLAGGMTSDALVRRLGVKWGRRSLGIIGLGSACLFTIAVMFTRDQVMTIVLLTLVYAGITFQQSGVFAVCLDIGRNHAGSVIGLMNMSAQVGGFISSLAFGYIVDASGSYDAPFVPMAMLLGVGAILWLRIDASTPINVPEPEAGVSQL